MDFRALPSTYTQFKSQLLDELGKMETVELILAKEKAQYVLSSSGKVGPAADSTTMVTMPATHESARGIVSSTTTQSYPVKARRAELTMTVADYKAGSIAKFARSEIGDSEKNAVRKVVSTVARDLKKTMKWK